MTYSATLRYLYSLQYRGIKVGLRNIRVLTASMGHPERSYPCFHCAGTNGKGSTTSFLASILTESGYRTGLYTSPHLVNFTERIRIDGVPIPERRLVEYTRELRPVIEETGSTFFEATTCIAFRYFADEGVDIAVIETGLGGRLDATNVVNPLVSIITNIGLDHQDILGNTIRKIAREKAGIIKSGSPVVTLAEGEALEVLKQTAKRLGTPLHGRESIVDSLAVLHPDRDRKIRGSGRTSGGEARMTLSVRFSAVEQLKAGGIRPGLPGAHQVWNASLAVAALTLVTSRGLFRKVTAGTIQRGLKRVVRNTGLRGRMERIQAKCGEIYVDVGHNPDGIRTVVNALLEQKIRFSCAVFGAMADKDTRGMLGELRRCVDKVIAVRPRIKRAATVAALVRQGRQLGIDMRPGGNVGEGIKKARDLVKNATEHRKPRILIVGSHYLAGEALSALEKNA